MATTPSTQHGLNGHSFSFSLPGIVGTLAALGYGAYAYRFRGPMSTSRYLMRLRVVAQSAIVGSMIVGALATSIYKSSKNE